MSKTKPFTIERQQVMDAYLRVRANKGRGGVDEISLEQFDKNYKNYLYKLWNQMSSGSYMPPPVLLVEIPKKDGSKRPLGIPKLLSYYMFLQLVIGMISIYLYQISIK